MKFLGGVNVQMWNIVKVRFTNDDSVIVFSMLKSKVSENILKYLISRQLLLISSEENLDNTSKEKWVEPNVKILVFPMIQSYFYHNKVYIFYAT